jgi:hypothetical protein
MKVGFSFNGSSFIFGMCVALAYNDIVPAWVGFASSVLLIDLPGPRLEYRSGEGFKFKWWSSLYS